MGIIRSQNGKFLVAQLNCQVRRYGYHNGRWNHTNNQKSLTSRPLWCWIINHSVPIKEIDGKSIRFLLDVHQQWKGYRYNLNHQNR